MNAFLHEMSNAYAKESIILVMDGAGWHKSKFLQVPDNIEIIILPPYSPELNPTERLWLYIKKNTIYNKVYENIAELKAEIAKFIKNISQNTIRSICGNIYMSN
jgi:transposase